MEKIRILVTDDHAMMRAAIKGLLENNSDITVVGEASEGREAYQKAQETAPDVIVMDLSMPSMNGIEATSLIKKRWPQIQILMLSQYDDKGHVMAAFKAGCTGYLSKDLHGADLLAAIQAVHHGEAFLGLPNCKWLPEDKNILIHSDYAGR